MLHDVMGRDETSKGGRQTLLFGNKYTPSKQTLRQASDPGFSHGSRIADEWHSHHRHLHYRRHLEHPSPLDICLSSGTL